MIIDIHSHVLPGIDDGSRDVEMSLDMLRKMKKDGVDVVCATPHYYAYKESIESFLKRRAASFQRLSPHLYSDIPEIVLGSEVALYGKLFEQNGIEKLCLGNSKCILIEMPFSQWGSYEYNMISDLCFKYHLQVILAHIERFEEYQRDDSTFMRIMNLPVYIQVNADTLIKLFGSKRMINGFSEGWVHLIGSDAHNMSSRVSHLVDARRILRKKCGESVLDEMDALGAKLLELKI